MENTFHSNWCHPLKITVIILFTGRLDYYHNWGGGGGGGWLMRG